MKHDNGRPLKKPSAPQPDSSPDSFAALSPAPGTESARGEVAGADDIRRELARRQIRAIAERAGLSVAVEGDATGKPPLTSGTDSGDGKRAGGVKGKRSGKVGTIEKSRTCPRFRITDRDGEIIRAIDRYRYLRTSQVKRLLFSEASDLQTTRRRLRLLSHPEHGYLLPVRPWVQVGKGNPETAYCIGPEGIKLLTDFGEEIRSPVSRKNAMVKHSFLAHALDLSEFRVKLELAFRTLEHFELHRFTADFEIKDHVKGSVKNPEAYKLYQEVRDEQGRPSVVYPDALIVLRGHGPHEGLQRLLFLEIDRGTEGISSAIRKKAIGYDLYHRLGVHRKFGEFEDFHVFIQTTGRKRAENIRSSLRGLGGEDRVLVSDVSRIHEETILTSPVWINSGGSGEAIIDLEEIGRG